MSYKMTYNLFLFILFLFLACSLILYAMHISYFENFETTIKYTYIHVRTHK